MKKKPDKHSLKILGVISSCGGGDWPPLLALATGMHKRGHDIMLVCDTETEARVRAAGLSALCLPLHLNLSAFFDPAIQRIFATGENLTPLTGNPLKEWAENSVDFILKTLGNWRPSLLLGSLLCLELGEKLAATLKVPWCFVNPAFHFGDNDTLPRKEDFSPLGSQMYEHWLLPKVRKATLVFHATDPVFDNIQTPLPRNHFHTGPLFWEISTPIPEYIHEPGSPWILISLSTAPQTAEMEIVLATLGALEDQDFRVLVTLPPGHEPIPSDSVPANAYIEGYVPHSIALSFCSLAISHAGHGTVIKSIYHGTPMVLVPWGRDQPGVASRAHSLGVATVVHRKDCKTKVLAKAIKQTINDPGIVLRSNTESLRLQKIDALSFACSKLESLFL